MVGGEGWWLKVVVVVSGAWWLKVVVRRIEVGIKAGQRMIASPKNEILETRGLLLDEI